MKLSMERSGNTVRSDYKYHAIRARLVSIIRAPITFSTKGPGMYRNLDRILMATAAVSAAGIASAAAQSTPAKAAAADTAAAGHGGKSHAAAPNAQSPWVTFNAATNTVTFKLEAGTNTAAVAVKSPFNFNGYTNGEATLVVPPTSNVVMNFVNEDGTPHSAAVIADKDPMPNADGDPAIPRAYTNKVIEGLPQGGKDVIRFTAPAEGTFRIFCGVPGHGLSGMWIYFKVDPAAKEPRWETKGS
jgi:hypothetical protein